MQKIILYIFAFSTILFLSNCATLNRKKVENFYKKNMTSVKKEPFREEIGFYLVDGAIIIPVKIEGRTYDFLLTTVQPSYITEEFAKELKLTSVIQDGDSFANIPKISIGNVDFNANLVMLSSCPFPKCGGFSGGVIGANIMRSATWKIDYENRKIIITNEHKLPQNKHETIDFDIYADGTPFTNIHFGPYDYTSVSLSISQYLELNLSDNYNSFMPSNQKYKGICYANKSKIDTFKGTTIPYIRFEGGLILKNQKTIFMPKYYQSDNYVGNNFFKNYATTFDWNLKKIILEPKEKLKEANNDKSFGFTFSYYEGKIIIGEVVDESSAKEVNLQLYDQVLALENLDLSNMTEDVFCHNTDICSLLCRDEITLKVKQKDTIKTVILKRKKMNF